MYRSPPSVQQSVKKNEADDNTSALSYAVPPSVTLFDIVKTTDDTLSTTTRMAPPRGRRAAALVKKLAASKNMVVNADGGGVGTVA